MFEWFWTWFKEVDFDLLVAVALIFLVPSLYYIFKSENKKSRKKK